MEKNFGIYFMSQKRRLFFLVCLACCLFFCLSAGALAANPPDYERAKAQLAVFRRAVPERIPGRPAPMNSARSMTIILNGICALPRFFAAAWPLRKRPE